MPFRWFAKEAGAVDRTTFLLLRVVPALHKNCNRVVFQKPGVDLYADGNLQVVSINSVLITGSRPMQRLGPFNMVEPSLASLAFQQVQLSRAFLEPAHYACELFF